MNFEPLEKVANAVLYEGFLLYPYRRSSLKNQQRWQFGTLGPTGGCDPCGMRTECLAEGSPEATLDVKIRFLQLDIEREITVPKMPLNALARMQHFSFGSLTGSVEVAAICVSDHLFKVSVDIRNESAAIADTQSCSMSSTHTLLAIEQGAFLSLFDPPDEYRVLAAGCNNVGTWPVLAGREGDRSLMLSSPIILYDYPQIAAESHGDFFDGTEIDEILTLRVMTLSDEEKRELSLGDERARQILERTEALPPEHLGKLHGAVRKLREASKLSFREGDRVRLRPRKGGDIFDIALNGKIAIVEAVERDLEERVHLAVTIEDDPGRDLGVARQIGHRFFFSPDEVEIV